MLHDLVHTQKIFPLVSAKRVSFISKANNGVFRDFVQILDCLETLCEVANKHGKLYDFSVKWPLLDHDKEKFSKDEIKEAEKMVFLLYDYQLP